MDAALRAHDERERIHQIRDVDKGSFPFRDSARRSREPQPSPRPQDNDGKGVVTPAPQVAQSKPEFDYGAKPTEFGKPWQLHDWTMVQVLDLPGSAAIGFPVIHYIVESAKGNVWGSDFLADGYIKHFDNLENPTFAQIKDNDEAYFAKWPTRTNDIDWNSLRVDQHQGTDQFMVWVKYHWTCANGKKFLSGSATVTAIVRPGTTSSGHEGYFIAGFWTSLVKDKKG